MWKHMSTSRVDQRHRIVIDKKTRAKTLFYPKIGLHFSSFRYISAGVK